ncbi:MAG: hypothetical protein OXE75_13505 [bacterium]|nr:hypothetical protein [bacterium]
MAVPTNAERRFELRLRPTGDGGDWGFEMHETTGGQNAAVANVPAARAARYRGDVLAAVTADGYGASTVGPRRRRPFNLTAEPGVRLALAVAALDPVRRADRRSAIAAGLSAMAAEEAFYWYARSVGPSGPRALRALRLLLAED